MLRDALLDLVDDEGLVDDFLHRVDEANEVAATRIARSTDTSTETPGEVVEEEEEEEEEEDETEENEETEETEENEEEESEVEETEEEEEVETEEEEVDEVQIILDDNFVTDLARSTEFQAAVATAVEVEINRLRTELENRFRALEETVEEEREWNQDVPARTKRAIVSFRARTTVEGDDDAAVSNGHTTHADVAESSISEIFD
jgi:hypothetical protein